MPTADEQAQIRIIVRSLEGYAERVVKRLVLDVTKGVVEATGVDTGWLRANWVPQVGSPYEGTVGSRPTSGEAVSVAASAARASGEAAILGYRLSQGPVWITNHVPYSAIRERRGFTQARNSRGEIEGPGFVLRAIEDAVRAAENLRPPR